MVFQWVWIQVRVKWEHGSDRDKLSSRGGVKFHAVLGSNAGRTTRQLRNHHVTKDTRPTVDNPRPWFEVVIQQTKFSHPFITKVKTAIVIGCKYSSICCMGFIYSERISLVDAAFWVCLNHSQDWLSRGTKSISSVQFKARTRVMVNGSRVPVESKTWEEENTLQ